MFQVECQRRLKAKGKKMVEKAMEELGKGKILDDWHGR